MLHALLQLLASIGGLLCCFYLLAQVLRKNKKGV